MRIEPIRLRYPKFVLDYRNQTDHLRSYFEYNPFTSFENRLEYLDKSKYNRKDLVKVLQEMNTDWNADESTKNNIHRLKSEDAVVVVGGQQAGLLTGPLYSINKVISIIQLAKKQEKELNRPVIPVFWIAGEDHDFDEINHVNIRTKNRMKKHTIQHYPDFKKSISEIDLDLDATQKWLADIFLELDESGHSRLLYTDLLNLVKKSKTYVDFFAQLINVIFKGTGLVLIDSGNASLKKIEAKYFIKIIENQEAIAKKVSQSVRSLEEKDYSISLEANENDGHLFYHDEEDERILLSKTEAGNWQGKNEEIEFTTKELIQLVKDSPNRFSNNVVTRPLMQEWLLPTLAFVGGYGEISYWASLKGAFKQVDLEMPPVVPRYSITYVSQKIDKLLVKNKVDLTEAVNQGVNQLKMNWLSNQSNAPIELLIEEMNKGIEQLHLPVQNVASKLGGDFEQLAQTNLNKIMNTTEYLKKRLLKEIENKYEKEIKEYDLINDYLYPDNGLQERIWNPLFILNENGKDFIKEVISTELSFDKDHYVIYL